MGKNVAPGTRCADGQAALNCSGAVDERQRHWRGRERTAEKPGSTDRHGQDRSVSTLFPIVFRADVQRAEHQAFRTFNEHVGGAERNGGLRTNRQNGLCGASQSTGCNDGEPCASPSRREPG